MRRTPRAAVAVGVLALLATAGAEEGRHDLSRKDAWRVGDVVTRTVRTTERLKMRVTDPAGQVVQSLDQTSATERTQVEAVLEVDAQGRATRRRVHFLAWSRAQGDAKDESLKGHTIEVTGLGADRKYVFAGGEPETSMHVREWLTKGFGSNGVDLDRIAASLRPKAPVSIGGAWEADAAEFVAGQGDVLPFDASKVTSRVTLVAVESRVAHVRCDITAPLRGMPGGPGMPPIPWTEGGSLVAVSHEHWPLDGRIGEGAAESRFTLAGTASLRGMTIRLEAEGTEENTLRVGGTMPEPATPR